jgi:parallel beta-helix repeat protein
MFGSTESLSSSFNSIALASGSGAVGLQWSNVSGATGYRVYGRTRGTETLLFEGVLTDFPVVTGLPTWTDTGALTPGTQTPSLVPGVPVSPSLVESNEVYLNNSHGVYLFAASGCTVRGNTCHRNGVHGVGLLNGSNDNLVELNTCYSNARITSRFACGVGCDFFGAGTLGSSRNVVQRNLCYSNEDSGISFFNGSNDCIARRNLSFNNGDHGIDNFNATGCHMINNTAVGNVTAGLNSEGGGLGGGAPSLGIRMYNNISVDNGIQSPRTSGNYRIDEFAVPDSGFDYNLSYLTIPAASQTVLANYEFQYDGHAYDTFDAMRAAYPGIMVHGVSADPRFIDRALDNYHVPSFSPAARIASTSAPDYTPDSFEGLDGELAAGALALDHSFIQTIDFAISGGSATAGGGLSTVGIGGGLPPTLRGGFLIVALSGGP